MPSSSFVAGWSHILCWYAAFAHIWRKSRIGRLVVLRIRSCAFDYHDLWMEFHNQGATIQLHGLTLVELTYINPSTILKQSQAPSAIQFCHMAIEKSDPHPTPNFGGIAPSSFLSSLHHLLASYEDLFSTPTGLPPPRSFDYRIPLLYNTASPS